MDLLSSKSLEIDFLVLRILKCLLYILLFVYYIILPRKYII